MRKPKLPNGRSELLALARDFRSVADDPRCGLGAMVRGALRVMEESALEPDEVLDLVPVKPLAELEPVI